eukprot:CAMPEP_0113832998 /NCGR_PEP_ID=MMETSP0328-20130328/7675_1 /TAXON_ID=39455 /ORGANISM="Alexandrium minutum" /LENGTH=51 /DNA_ID=CAMNT_0000801243 /DNA_START=18 /DNA_END=171 /DNA_ORIENTATION=+ /assembly_acc=CAM_ASM_000350
MTAQERLRKDTTSDLALAPSGGGNARLTAGSGEPPNWHDVHLLEAWERAQE